mmetsp:Transcript_26345/g.60701  ORF Transcript_26345/g.60701 Transcript_26345/m.60701 type:complete len:353 (-) Transcript_26345:822-1880(-)
MGTAHSSFPPPSNSVPAPFLKKKKAPPLHKSRRGIAIIDPFPRTWSDLHAACDAATDAATLLGDDGGHPPVPEPLPAPAPSNDDAAPAPPEKKNSDDDYVAVTWERGGHYDHFVPIVRRDALLGGVAAGRRGLRRGTSSAGFVRMPRMDRVNFPITRRVRTEEKICVLARKKRRPRPPDDEVSGDAADRYDVLTLAEFSTIHRLLGALREVLLVGSRPVHDIPPRPVVAVASSSRSFDTEDGEDDVPTALWRRQRRQREEDAQYDEECQICMDHPVNVVFPCGHTCCQKCMRQWLGESGHCFMCRREVMGNSKQGNLWKSGEPEDECWQVHFACVCNVVLDALFFYLFFARS